MTDITHTQLIDFISRYSSINRFSHVSMIRPESLFNHISSVGLLSLFMIESINQKGLDQVGELIFSKEDQCDLFQKILLHDMDEIVTGDVPRTTKHNNEEMHKLFKEIEIKGIEVLFNRYNLPERWKYLWSTAKDNQIGEILSLADIMSVVIICYQEIYFYSNNSFRVIADEVKEYIISRKLKAEELSNQYKLQNDKKKEIISSEVNRYLSMCLSSLSDLNGCKNGHIDDQLFKINHK